MKFDVPGYLKDRGVPFKLNQKEAICTCVWCGRERHLYVNTKNGNYICFKCEERGKGLVGLVARLEGCSHKEASKFLKVNQPTPQRNSTLAELKERLQTLKKENPEDSEVSMNLPEEFVPVFKKGEWRYPLYLKERGISRETCRAYSVGYCNSGRYNNRIVLPYVCPNGSGFTARDITGYARQKYLNASDVNRRALLYGWEQVQRGSDLVLVEGPFDVLKLYEHGIASLGLLGKSLSQGQFGLLSKFPSDTPITLMLDPEADIDSLQIIQTLSSRFPELYDARLPEDVDPGDSTSEQAWQAINESEKIENSRLKLLEKRMFHMKRRWDELSI